MVARACETSSCGTAIRLNQMNPGLDLVTQQYAEWSHPAIGPDSQSMVNADG